MDDLVKKAELEKQIIIRTYVNQGDILWDNTLRNHIVTIDFKYDINTDVYYDKVININYLKSGWRFDEKDLSYVFHKKIPRKDTLIIRGEVIEKIRKSSLDVRLKDKNGPKNKFGI